MNEPDACTVPRGERGAGAKEPRGDARPHVVIVGGGFGGLRAARGLAKAPVRVTLLDRRNYHLFQPLLYQVATAGLEAEQIAHPLRAILRRQANAEFRLADLERVDFGERRLLTSSGPIDYDYLVLAIGSATNYFGIDSVEEHGLGLKSIEEAVAIRNQVLQQFELGVQESDPEVRRARLTFVVVGGGPTGVEVSGMLSELSRIVLRRDLPQLDPADVRVLLLEAGDRLLAGFPKELSRATARILSGKRVEIRFGAAVTRFDGQNIVLESGEVVHARTLIWAAGAQAACLADRLGLEQGPLRRIRVDESLRVPGQDRVFVVGDAAFVAAAERPLPMMAPVAIQQGALAARNILRVLRGETPEAFVYRDPGSLATIGRNAAVARLGRLRFQGFFAWVLWLVVHLVQLIGFRNRLLVLINWAWDYFLYDRAVRLVTTPLSSPPPTSGNGAAEEDTSHGA